MDAKQKKELVDTITQETMEVEVLLSRITEATKSLKIHGRTKDEWWSFFKIALDKDNVNPSIVREKLALLCNKWGVASKALSRAKTEKKYIDSIIEAKKNSIKKKLRLKNTKIGAGNLREFSGIEVSELKTAQNGAKIALMFWEDINEYLTNILKTLNQLNFADNNDAKLQPITP